MKRKAERQTILGTRGFFSPVISRPWIDPLLVAAMGKILFPASRLWAAAAKAKGNSRLFSDLTGISRISESLQQRLARTAALRETSELVSSRWEEATFGSGRDLAFWEARRRQAAQDYFLHRFSYVPLAYLSRTPAVDFDIPAPAEIQAELGGALSHPADYYRLPASFPAIERGPSIDRGDVLEYWLRMPSENGMASDAVIVHVYEPKGRKDAPSLIFGHGLAMETEMVAEPLPEFFHLAKAGMRVLLPDAPGHNRRCAIGRYGGESFLRRAPISSLAHFRQVALEWAALTSWCRGQGSRRVAAGGISLGALSATIMASHWKEWPSEARADSLFMVTTTDRISGLPLHSSLASSIGLDRAIRAKGWDDTALAILEPIADAQDEPLLDPEAIVLVLGARDNLTPIDGGRRLAKKWNVPPANLFIRDQGHFSTAIGLRNDPAPFQRLKEILQA